MLSQIVRVDRQIIKLGWVDVEGVNVSDKDHVVQHSGRGVVWAQHVPALKV